MESETDTMACCVVKRALFGAGTGELAARLANLRGRRGFDAGFHLISTSRLYILNERITHTTSAG